MTGPAGAARRPAFAAPAAAAAARRPRRRRPPALSLTRPLGDGRNLAAWAPRRQPPSPLARPARVACGRPTAPTVASAAGDVPLPDLPSIPDDLDLDPTGRAAAVSAAAEAATEEEDDDDEAAADAVKGEDGRRPVSMANPPAPARNVSRWTPEGLLGPIVDEKRLETELLEADLAHRPDHPLNLRLAFYAPSTPGRLGRAIRRGDGRLAIIGALKRFAPAAYDDARGLSDGRWSSAAGNMDDGRGGPPPQTGRLLSSLDDIGRDGRRLAAAGVSALAVHVDERRYGTDITDLAAVVKSVAGTSAEPGPPVLAADVVVHPLQIAAAAEAGATAVTIVAGAALPDLEALLNTATLLGLEGVVEVASDLEVAYALDVGATALYLTDVDRSTGRLRPGAGVALRRGVPEWVTTIAGGGFTTAGDAWAAADAGFDAVLLGEVLLRNRRLDGYVAEVTGRERDVSRRFFEAMGYDGRDDPAAKAGARRL